jgi:hypothetical protein
MTRKQLLHQWQTAGAAPGVPGRRCAQEVNMVWKRAVVAVAILVLGFLMAWDSNVWTSIPAVVALVSLAVLVPAAAGMLSGHRGVHAGAVIASLGLLIAARLISDVEIRWYAMAFIFYVVLLAGWLFERRFARA